MGRSGSGDVVAAVSGVAVDESHAFEQGSPPRTMRHMYGPVPSRRLGSSLGVSPIPKKVCNYSCIYCQLGRTDRLTNTRQMFFPVSEIVAEFDEAAGRSPGFDVVTVVGEGEPTLYLGLGELLDQIQCRTDKPVAVITNGALLGDPSVRSDLSRADIVLPSLDAWDQASYRRINRPHRLLRFEDVHQGLKEFAETFEGQLWLEIMLMEGINADDSTLGKYAGLLTDLTYDRLCLNTPVRPPAEPYVRAVDHATMMHAAEVLGGVSIDLLQSVGFHSDIPDDYEAVRSIIKRHPMNQHEIEGFLESRGHRSSAEILERLRRDDAVAVIHYKGYDTFRLRPDPGRHDGARPGTDGALTPRGVWP